MLLKPYVIDLKMKKNQANKNYLDKYKSKHVKVEKSLASWVNIYYLNWLLAGQVFRRMKIVCGLILFAGNYRAGMKATSEFHSETRKYNIVVMLELCCFFQEWSITEGKLGPTLSTGIQSSIQNKSWKRNQRTFGSTDWYENVQTEKCEE